ncbi:hypothetical protein Tco_0532002 [Tanacetum coccineum]
MNSSLPKGSTSISASSGLPNIYAFPGEQLALKNCLSVSWRSNQATRQSLQLCVSALGIMWKLALLCGFYKYALKWKI